MGGGHLWPVANTWRGGRPEVLSQLLLHVSYVFLVSLAVASEILSAWTHESNRVDGIESSLQECRIRR